MSDTETRAEWDAAYVNDLPDSAFAVILPGGEKDDEGKTTPRDLRKLPHHNAAGDVDMPHLRNAISRESQADMPEAMHERAQSHLESHMEATRAEDGKTWDGTVEVAVDPSDIQVRDATKREIEVRLLPWDTTIETSLGPEEFRRGAIAGTAQDGVLLMGLEHEAHMGLGQNGQPVLTRRPAGRSTAVWEADDGPHVTFRVARTQAGDELLALAEDRIVRGVSLEFKEVPGGTSAETRNGRRVRVHNRVALTGASMTYRPAYGERAAVLAVRSQAEGEGQMAETSKAPAVDEPETEHRIEAISESFEASLSKFGSRIIERLEAVEEQSRSQFTIPSGTSDGPVITMGEWTSTVFKLLTGDRIPDAQMRTVQDLITSDNAGVVPEAFISELRGVVDASRPFMETTRRLPTPGSGTTIRVPKITQRPTVAEQTSEKSELSSQKTIIGSDTFEMITKGGVGDLSLQLLKRSDPSFLDLYVRLLAEAYAIEADSEAVGALINAMGGNGTAGPLDPEALALGSAFSTSYDAIRRAPDTIWMSTEALAAFIDAKASTTNAPLYSNIVSNMTAGDPVRGTISGLRVVHVPALDAHGAYALVGPSSGFAWAEDGTYTLQVDVPAKAGRDVALVGMLWFIPWYPDAFTLYNVAS